jgi:hypothetical protein
VLFGSIYGAFLVCDTNTSKHVKAEYASILKTGRYIHFFNVIPAIVLSIFEQIFGTTHASLKCFRRSAYVSVASLASIFAFTALYRLPVIPRCGRVYR